MEGIQNTKQWYSDIGLSRLYGVGMAQKVLGQS